MGKTKVQKGIRNDLAGRVEDSGLVQPNTHAPLKTGFGNPFKQIPDAIRGIGKAIARADSLAGARTLEKFRRKEGLVKGGSPSTISQK